MVFSSGWRDEDKGRCGLKCLISSTCTSELGYHSLLLIKRIWIVFSRLFICYCSVKDSTSLQVAVHRFAAQCSCFRQTIYQCRQRFAKTAFHPAGNDDKGSREMTSDHHLREWLNLYQMIGISWWRCNSKCNTGGSFAFRQPSFWLLLENSWSS